jgi:uncharacterized membrane protein YfhO
VWDGDVPQARVEQGDIVIENVSRTQNTFTIDVDANAPGRIRVNSPYERGWQTDYGTIDNDKKLLVVDVPAGRAEIHLRYWPHGLTAGFVLTSLGVSATIAFFVWDARRRKVAHASTDGPAPVA